MNRAEKAQKYFKEGYACSQAVVLAFEDLLDVDKLTLAKMALPFGGGIGRLRLTCGAVTGMAMVAGLLLAKDENTPENKMATYEIVRELAKRFEKENETIVCEKLLELANVEAVKGGTPDERNEHYYRHRPCDELVYNAAKILEDYLIEVGRI